MTTSDNLQTRGPPLTSTKVSCHSLYIDNISRRSKEKEEKPERLETFSENSESFKRDYLNGNIGTPLFGTFKI